MKRREEWGKMERWKGRRKEGEKERNISLTNYVFCSFILKDYFWRTTVIFSDWLRGMFV